MDKVASWNHFSVLALEITNSYSQAGECTVVLLSTSDSSREEKKERGKWDGRFGILISSRYLILSFLRPRLAV